MPHSLASESTQLQSTTTTSTSFESTLPTVAVPSAIPRATQSRNATITASTTRQTRSVTARQAEDAQRKSTRGTHPPGWMKDFVSLTINDNILCRYKNSLPR